MLAVLDDVMSLNELTTHLNNKHLKSKHLTFRTLFVRLSNGLIT